MVKNSSVHTHTEWSDAIPVGSMSVGSTEVETGLVGLVAVPSMLSSPLPLLPLPMELSSGSV